MADIHPLQRGQSFLDDVADVVDDDPAVRRFLSSVGDESPAEASVPKEHPKEPEHEPWPPMAGDVSAFLTSPPPAQRWHSRDRLLADRAHLLTGIGGTSKTRMLYHIAIGSIIGRVPWGWDISRCGSAVLFLAEDTAGQVHRTLAAFAEHGEFTHDELAMIGQRLKVFPLAGHPTKLLTLFPGTGLQENYRVAELLETCRAIPDLVFVGLDPALALSEGDELNPAHQRRLGELADRIALELGACVVLTSHAAKALQSAEEIGSHSSRGSGAITDAVRAEFVLRSMTTQEAKRYGITDTEERKAHVQLLATKGNELPPAAFVPIWLRRGSSGLLSLACLEEADADEVAPSPRDLQALDVLCGLTAKGTVSVVSWGRECAGKGLISGTDSGIEKAIHRIKKTLLAAGLIKPGIGRGVFVPVDGGDQ